VVAPPPIDHPIQPPVDSVGEGDSQAASGAGGSTFSPLPPPPLRPEVAHGAVTPQSSTVFGVIVGINDYPGSGSDLRAAVADADDMSDALALNGVPDSNVTELVDGTATAANISNALHWAVASTTADSTVVFFYAGHVRKVSDNTEAIVAADGSLLPDWYLAQELAPMPAKKVWIVMAACYGGGFTELLSPGRVLTAAADANSLAYENDSFGRSYLDEYLVHQGLLEQDAPAPTVQAAFNYAQSGLERDYPNRTLTEVDQSTGPISLDGVNRDGDPNASGSGGGSPPPRPPSGSPPPQQSPSPPSSPPSPPPPCRNVLGLFCPPGSR
jgi:hypothetical protein